MAFAVRTNVSYDGSGDENSPAPGHTVSFSVKDFLHIKEVWHCQWCLTRNIIRMTFFVDFMDVQKRLQTEGFYVKFVINSQKFTHR